MNVLFGTIEYFEREILFSAKKKSVVNITSENVLQIHSELEAQLQNEFVCAENIRRECIHNLMMASQKFLNK